MKFSPSTSCFYPDDIAYPDGAVPPDAIDATDQDFAAWCAAAPGSTIAVQAGTIAIVPPAAPEAVEIKSALLVHAAAVRDQHIGGGITVDVGTSDAPLVCQVDTSASARADLNGLAVCAQSDPDATVRWVQSSGTLNLSSAQIIVLQKAVTTFVTSTWVAFGTVSTKIEAGTICTAADIDKVDWSAASATGQA